MLTRKKRRKWCKMRYFIRLLNFITLLLRARLLWKNREAVCMLNSQLQTHTFGWHSLPPRCYKSSRNGTPRHPLRDCSALFGSSALSVSVERTQKRMCGILSLFPKQWIGGHQWVGSQHFRWGTNADPSFQEIFKTNDFWHGPKPHECNLTVDYQQKFRLLSVKKKKKKSPLVSYNSCLSSCFLARPSLDRNLATSSSLSMTY